MLDTQLNCPWCVVASCSVSTPVKSLCWTVFRFALQTDIIVDSCSVGNAAPAGGRRLRWQPPPQHAQRRLTATAAACSLGDLREGQLALGLTLQLPSNYTVATEQAGQLLAAINAHPQARNGMF